MEKRAGRIYTEYGKVEKREEEGSVGLQDKSLKAELMKQRKEDIVEGICDLFNADYFARSILDTASHRAGMRQIGAEKNAFDKLEDAEGAYRAWVERMTAKYGENGKLDLTKIPFKEIKIAKALREEIDRCREKAIREMDKTNRQIKMR